MSKTFSLFNASYDFRFLSEKHLHLFLFFIRYYNHSRRSCDADVSAAYWTRTTDQTTLTFLLLVTLATVMPDKKKTSVSCLLSL